jgi:hypothetical protein
VGEDGGEAPPEAVGVSDLFGAVSGSDLGFGASPTSAFISLVLVFLYVDSFSVLELHTCASACAVLTVTVRPCAVPRWYVCAWYLSSSPGHCPLPVSAVSCLRLP